MSCRPSLLRQISCILGIVMLMGSCSKKGADQPHLSSDAEIVSFGFNPGQDTVSIAGYNHSVTVHLSDAVTSGKSLIAKFSLSPGAIATVNNIPQTSGVTGNNFGNDLTYVVTAADRTTKKSWTIRASNNDYSIDFGLGHFLNQGLSNDRGYEWYIDQATSGPVAGYNCGPSSVTMAIKWADSGFTHTAAEARNFAYNDGGWWYTSDIDSYLTKYDIPYVTIALSPDSGQSAAILRKQLDNGQIVICCIDMNYVRPSADFFYHVDKFYPTTPGWGHFFVVKGYQWIDEQLYFQIYDPYSYGVLNADNTLKGKNRFYRYADVGAATSRWWNYAIVVGKKGRPLNTDAIRRAVDPASIPRGHSTGLPGTGAVFPLK